jgi:hypothetical protein
MSHSTVLVVGPHVGPDFAKRTADPAKAAARAAALAAKSTSTTFPDEAAIFARKAAELRASAAAGTDQPRPDNAEEWLAPLLAPFDENENVDPYHRYEDPLPETWRESLAHRAEFRRLLETGLARMVAWKQVWGERNDDAYVPPVYSVAIEQGVDPTDLPAVAAAYDAKWEIGPPAEGEEDERHYVDEKGIYTWSTYNPRSRWDWWSIGGRWSGYLLLRPDATGARGRPGSMGETEDDGEGVDVARAGDIDWEAMGMRRRAKAEGWWAEYEAALADGDEHAGFRFGVEHDETREQYLARCSSVATFAVLKDDEWFERGRMGWWGGETARDEWDRRFVELVQGLHPDRLLAVCDVHI